MKFFYKFADSLFSSSVQGNYKDRLRISNIVIIIFVVIQFVMYQSLTCLPMTIISGFYLLLNVFSMAMFHQGKSIFAVLLHYFTTGITTILACLFFGWNFGYSLFTFVMILVFYYYVFVIRDLHHSLNLCTPFAGIHLLIMGFVRFYVYKFGALAPNYSITTAYIVSMINWFTCGILLIYYISLFVYSLQHNNEMMEEKNNELQHMALYDMLTGFRNRQTIGEDIVKMIQYAKVNNKDFTLLLSDIDDFKKVNDAHGHAQGDKVLMRISSVFLDYLPEGAIICRWGGEEFLICIPDNLETAKAYALKVQHKLSEIEFKSDNKNYHISVTFGIQPLDSANMDFQTLIQMADDHLYTGKQRGKNCIAYQNFIWRY